MDESPETVSLGGFTVQVTVNRPTDLIATGSLDHLVRVDAPVPDSNIVYDL